MLNTFLNCWLPTSVALLHTQVLRLDYAIRSGHLYDHTTLRFHLDNEYIAIDQYEGSNVDLKKGSFSEHSSNS